ncbi:hypothetical protein JMJ56_19585 [Belnapia sp. T18]|uniref:Transposase n=1 Tax=Belnapia arida TaxID=2804533 RepID=A0ABS1U6A1_9PROT|nr:hypothetical protein [Belnapia arida]MBL6080224.1 hypothetical protein [Belnapia arida]
MRHYIENLLSWLKHWVPIALRRNKTHCKWMGFAQLVATILSLRIAEFSYRAWFHHYGWFSEQLRLAKLPERN